MLRFINFFIKISLNVLSYFITMFALVSDINQEIETVIKDEIIAIKILFKKTI